jgi:hypothetical protein
MLILEKVEKGRMVRAGVNTMQMQVQLKTFQAQDITDIIVIMEKKLLKNAKISEKRFAYKLQQVILPQLPQLRAELIAYKTVVNVRMKNVV